MGCREERDGQKVQLMGLGTRAYMPDGLGAKINALRRFVAGRNPQDLVICADAFDVLAPLPE